MPTHLPTAETTKLNKVKEGEKLKFHSTKSDLFKGIQAVFPAISNKSTLPVLSNILFESTSEGLRLSATDLEVGIRTWIKADVTGKGSITIPAKILMDFIKTLEDDREIKLQVSENNKIEIKSGRDRLNVTGLPSTDYPVLPEFDEKKVSKISKKVLRDLVKKTMFAASSDGTRYVLNGIHLIVEDGKATAVATDGRRLAFIQRDLADKKLQAKVIIPSKAIGELLRVVSDDKSDADVVKVTFSDNQAGFSCDGLIILSRLIEGHFPNYEQVIPKSHEVQLALSRSALMASVSRAAVGTLERGGSVRMALSKGALRIQAAAQGRVEVESELAVNYEGTNFEIAFNPAYMTDFLKSLDQEDVLLELTSPLNPGVFRPAGDDSHRYIMMPMK